MVSISRRFAPLLVVVLAICLTAGPISPAWAGEDPEEGGLPEAGLLPGSPFYFIKRLTEGLRLGLLRTPEARASYLAHLIEVRLAEAETLAERGKIKLLERTLARYEELAGKGAEELDKASRGDRDMTEALLALEAATRKSEGVLSRVLARVPEQAREAIRTALRTANQGNETCLRVMERVAAGDGPGRPEIVGEVLARIRAARQGGKSGQGQGPGGD